MAHYSLREAGLGSGDDEACLRWQTWDGTPYEGCDEIRSVPPHGFGKEESR